MARPHVTPIRERLYLTGDTLFLEVAWEEDKVAHSYREAIALHVDDGTQTRCVEPDELIGLIRVASGRLRQKKTKP